MFYLLVHWPGVAQASSAGQQAAADGRLAAAAADAGSGLAADIAGSGHRLKNKAAGW